MTLREVVEKWWKKYNGWGLTDQNKPTINDLIHALEEEARKEKEITKEEIMFFINMLEERYNVDLTELMDKLVDDNRDFVITITKDNKNKLIGTPKKED